MSWALAPADQISAKAVAAVLSFMAFLPYEPIVVIDYILLILALSEKRSQARRQATR
jgi:hypothetical protein